MIDERAEIRDFSECSTRYLTSERSVSQRQCLFFFRLLDLGFERDVSSILTAIQKALFPGVKCQTVLLSATLNEGTLQFQLNTIKANSGLLFHMLLSQGQKRETVLSPPLPQLAGLRKSAMIATKGAKAMLSNEVLVIRLTFPDLPSRETKIKLDMIIWNSDQKDLVPLFLTILFNH